MIGREVKVVIVRDPACFKRRRHGDFGREVMMDFVLRRYELVSLCVIRSVEEAKSACCCCCTEGQGTTRERERASESETQF